MLDEFSVGTATAEQAEEKLDFLEAHFSRMEADYLLELPYWAYLEDLLPIAEDVETTFCLLTLQVGELRECLHEQSAELPECLQSLTVTQNRLLNHFQATQTLLSAEESYSDSPYINELIRVAYAVLEERLPLETLQARLQAYFEVFHASAEALSDYPSDEVQEAIDLLDQGLVLINSFVQDNKLEESLEEGLAVLEEGAYLLTLAQANLEAEESRQRERICHRCSAQNEATHKSCAVCGATLLTLVGGVDSGFDVRVSESGVRSVAPTHSEHVERILSGVDKVMRGEPMASELERHLSTFNRGLHSLTLQLKRVSSSEEGVVELCDLLRAEVHRCAESFGALRSALGSHSALELQQAREVFEDSVLTLQNLQKDYRNIIGR